MSALPPYALALGMEIVDEEESGAAPLLRLPPAEKLRGRPGFLHGGAIAGLLEIAALTALRRALGPNRAPTRAKPINVTVSFLRGGLEVETFARGHVLRLGARVANVDAEAWQADHTRPIAAARLNILLSRESRG